MHVVAAAAPSIELARSRSCRLFLFFLFCWLKKARIRQWCHLKTTMHCGNTEVVTAMIRMLWWVRGAGGILKVGGTHLGGLCARAQRARNFLGYPPHFWWYPPHFCPEEGGHIPSTWAELHSCFALFSVRDPRSQRHDAPICSIA